MVRLLKRFYHLAIAVAANIRFGFPARKLTVIGVTGTDGKTTTSSVLFTILREAGIRVSAITTVSAVIAGREYDTGFHVTTPDAWSIQKYLRQAADAGDTHVVLEVTSHGIDQFRIWGIPFAVGVITNVTHEHLDYHGTYEDYLRTKMKLPAMAATAVINVDDGNILSYLAVHPLRSRIITYGRGNDAGVNPEVFRFTSPLPGEYNVSNCLAAAAAAMAIGVSADVAKRAIGRFGGVPGRMTVITQKPFTVIVDFAHTPNALERVLSTVRKTTRGRLIHVFGSAGLRDATKRPMMGEASARYADTAILTEEDYRTERLSDICDAISTGIGGKIPVERIENRGEAIARAIALAKPGDTVIVTGKGHERSLCRGTVEYPWNDIDETRKLMQSYAAKQR
jgi:UDP-N-acetylmuramoyl-L-alanyl-D-glutamate--2,6-diaminopimelate ligase